MVNAVRPAIARAMKITWMLTLAVRPVRVVGLERTARCFVNATARVAAAVCATMRALACVWSTLGVLTARFVLAAGTDTCVMCIVMPTIRALHTVHATPPVRVSVARTSLVRTAHRARWAGTVQTATCGACRTPPAVLAGAVMRLAAACALDTSQATIALCAMHTGMVTIAVCFAV